MKTACIYPDCGQHIEYSEEHAGKAFPCPKCGRATAFPSLGFWHTKTGKCLRWVGMVLLKILRVLLFAIAQTCRFIASCVEWCIRHLLGLVGILFLIITIIGTIWLPLVVMIAPLYYIMGFGMGFILIGIDIIINKLPRS